MALTTRHGGVEASAWQSARARFLDSLPDNEHVLFENASPENLFYASSAAFKKYDSSSKLQAARKKIQPMVDSIAAYGKAMDVFANMSPMVLGPLWGSLRIVLNIAQEYSKYFDKLVEMFVRIGDVLPRFHGYETLFPSYEVLRQALASAYLTIIEFCIDARSVFVEANKSSVSWATCKAAWKPFAKRFDKYLSDLRSYQENAEKEVALCHMTEAKKAREMQKQESIAKKRQKLLGLLPPLDYKSHHRRLQKLRHQGTGSWLAEVPSLRAWLQDQTSGCFCCFGIPGSGKTILASTIIDSMSPFYTEVDAAICYHYCDYANASSLDVSIILGTLIRQLLERIQIPAAIAADIDNYFDEGATKPQSEDLIDLWDKVLRVFNRVMVVLDGLDELVLSEQKVIIGFIHQLSQSSNTITKVMVFSRREEKLIRPALHEYNFIDISTKLVRNDLARFIDDSIQLKLDNHELSIGDPGLKQIIIDALVEGAEDMFLWVKFQLEELCEALTDEEIRHTLQNLPKDLAATYARILERYCTSQGGEARIKIMRKIFPWIACARRRLTIDELSEAYAIDVDDNHLHREKIPTDYKRILEACGSLILFDKDDRTLSFAHNTVKQFLVSSTNTSDIVSTLRFKLDEAEFRVGEACITYLSFSDFETQVIKLSSSTALPVQSNMVQGTATQIPFGKALYTIRSLASTRFSFNNDRTPKPFLLPLPKAAPPSRELEERYRLLDYVVHNWPWHTFQFTPQKSPSTWAKFRALALERQLPFDIRPWASSNNESDHAASIRSDLEFFRWAVNDQDLSAFLRLLDHSMDGNKLKMCIDYEPAWGRDPFIQAVENGHYELVRLLLKIPEIVESLMGATNSALSLAIGTGDVHVVELLLAHGADVNARPIGGLRTPLYEAMVKGDSSLVELLLANGADINTGRDHPWGTALFVASQEGNSSIVKLLLAHGADVNLGIGGRIRTPLCEASRRGYSSIVELLLANGANINAGRDDPCGTALYVASQEGHSSIVKLLLAHGADVNATIKDWNRSPLYEASLKGYSVIVELLLRNGADVNVRREVPRGTPLHMASQEGHTSIVRLLLAHGVEVNVAQGGLSNAPLCVASEGGHTAIVRLLLEHGAHINQPDGWSPALGAARLQRHKDIISLLQSWGAEI